MNVNGGATNHLLGDRSMANLNNHRAEPRRQLAFGYLSDIGMMHTTNQDAVFSSIFSCSSSDDIPTVGIFIVADGMGGHQDGEKASSAAVRIITSDIVGEIFTPLLEQTFNDPERPSMVDILTITMQKANDVIMNDLPDSGTTATVAIVIGELAYIGHVGDSRAYLITGDQIEQITRDHSLVQRLIELGQLTPEEALTHARRNVLYRSVGQSDDLDVDCFTRRLPPSSYLLLCSDGLWNLVSDATIQDIIRQSSDIQEACNSLVQLANERGGADNITVLIVRV
jgi:PPM family protein phosphatase